jgi:hypothetical protein
VVCCPLLGQPSPPTEGLIGRVLPPADLLGDLDRLDRDLFGGLGGSEEDNYSDDGDTADEEGVRNLEDEPWNGISGGDDGNDPMQDVPSDDDLEEPSEEEDDEDKAAWSPSVSPPPPQLVPSIEASSTLAAPASGKYVPPALRARLAAEAAAAAGGSSEADLRKKEELLKLEKTVNGLLNRLGESNIDAILGELEAVYRKYPRNGPSWLEEVSALPHARAGWLTLCGLLCSRRHDDAHQPRLDDHLGPLESARLVRRPLRRPRRRPLQDHRHRVWSVSLPDVALSAKIGSRLTP